MRRYLTWLLMAIGFIALVAVALIAYRVAVDDEPVGLDDLLAWVTGKSSKPDTGESAWEFDVDDSVRIIVEVAESDVRVIRGDSGIVSVESWLVGQAADPGSYAIEAKSGGASSVRVSAHPLGGWSPSMPGRGRITITVPEQCALAIDTRRGSVLIEEIIGLKGIRVNGGDILLNGGGGEFHAITRQGNIMIERYKGGGTAETELGEAALSLVDGNVSVIATEQVEARSHFGALSVSTQRGRILAELLRPDSLCILTIIDGDIEVNNASGTGLNLDISAPPGGIMNGFHLDPSSTLSSDSSRLVGTVNGGGVNLTARTSDGMVKLGDGGE